MYFKHVYIVYGRLSKIKKHKKKYKKLMSLARFNIQCLQCLQINYNGSRKLLKILTKIIREIH